MADNHISINHPSHDESQGQKQFTDEHNVAWSDTSDGTPRSEESGTLTDDEKAEKPIRDPDKSVNGPEFDRQGRNPKPFRIGG